MRVPAADVGEGDLDADAAPDELRDLLERAAELAGRVLHAARRAVLLRVDGAQQARGLEGVVGGAGDDVTGRIAVDPLERLLRGRAARLADAEPLEVRNRERRRTAAPMATPRSDGCSVVAIPTWPAAWSAAWAAPSSSARPSHAWQAVFASVRFSQPSRVDFTPGVAVSM